MTSSGRGVLLPRLLGVGLDEVDDALDQRVREALLDGRVAPGEVELRFFLPLPLTVLGELDQALGRVGAAVEEHVLDVLEQLRSDLLVDRELPGVDDAHVHARP